MCVSVREREMIYHKLQSQFLFIQWNTVNICLQSSSLYGRVREYCCHEEVNLVCNNVW